MKVRFAVLPAKNHPNFGVVPSAIRLYSVHFHGQKTLPREQLKGFSGRWVDQFLTKVDHFLSARG